MNRRAVSRGRPRRRTLNGFQSPWRGEANFRNFQTRFRQRPQHLKLQPLRFHLSQLPSRSVRLHPLLILSPLRTPLRHFSPYLPGNRLQPTHPKSQQRKSRTLSTNCSARTKPSAADLANGNHNLCVPASIKKTPTW
jgi:hypothetical protein